MDTLINIKNSVINGVTTATTFVYNASSIEILKLKRNLLIENFENIKKQNELYHKLVNEKKHLEQLILRINQEKSYYDFKIAEIVFDENITDNIVRHDYEKITIVLQNLNNTLQQIYGDISSVSAINDEYFEKEHKLFQKSLENINNDLRKVRFEKNHAREQLEKIKHDYIEFSNEDNSDNQYIEMCNIDESAESAESADLEDVDNTDGTYDTYDTDNTNKLLKL